MEINNNKGIEESFDITLKDANLGNLIAEMTELGIDSLLKDGILRDVPIINSLLSLSKFGASVRDKLFAKKILSFLIGLKDIPAEERRKVISNLDNSKKYRIKVREKLLFIIDNCQDYENSERIAFLFKAFLQNKITYKDFLECTNTLEKITTDNFMWFLKNGYRYNIGTEEAGSLVNSGLFVVNANPINVQIKENEGPFNNFVIPGSLKAYKANVEGGSLELTLSHIGKIIIRIFDPEPVDLKKSHVTISA